MKQGNSDWKRCDAIQTETSQTTTKSESTQASQGITTTSSSAGIGPPAVIEISDTIGNADAVIGDDSHGDPCDAGAQVENMLPVSLGIDERYEASASGSIELADTVLDFSIQSTKIANTTNTKNHSCSESSSTEIEDEITLTKNDPAAYAGIRIDQSIIRSLLNKPYYPPQSFTFPNTNRRQCSRTCFSEFYPTKLHNYENGFHTAFQLTNCTAYTAF